MLLTMLSLSHRIAQSLASRLGFGRPPLICPHFALSPLDALLALAARSTAYRAAVALSRVGLLLAPLLVIQLDKPVVLGLVLTVGILLARLETMARNPFTRGLVEDEPALLLGKRVVLADALFAGEQVPFRRRLRGRQRLVARHGRLACGQGQQHGGGWGRGHGAGGDELIEERLSAVTGSGIQGGIERCGGKWGGGVDRGREVEGVGVLGQEETQVEGVWSGLGDSDGAAEC